MFFLIRFWTSLILGHLGSQTRSLGQFKTVACRDKSSYEMLRTLNWLAFPVRRKYFIGLLIFKAINNLTPSYISDLITFSSNNTYVLRSIAKRDISHNKPNTNYLKKTFSYSGISIMNYIVKEGITWNNIAVINVSFLHWCVILMVYLLKIKNLLLLLLLHW